MQKQDRSNLRQLITRSVFLSATTCVLLTTPVTQAADTNIFKPVSVKVPTLKQVQPKAIKLNQQPKRKPVIATPGRTATARTTPSSPASVSQSRLVKLKQPIPATRAIGSNSLPTTFAKPSRNSVNLTDSASLKTRSVKTPQFQTIQLNRIEVRKVGQLNMGVGRAIKDNDLKNPGSSRLTDHANLGDKVPFSAHRKPQGRFGSNRGIDFALVDRSQRGDRGNPVGSIESMLGDRNKHRGSAFGSMVSQLTDNVRSNRGGGMFDPSQEDDKPPVKFYFGDDGDSSVGWDRFTMEVWMNDSTDGSIEELQSMTDGEILEAGKEFFGLSGICVGCPEGDALTFSVEETGQDQSNEGAKEGSEESTNDNQGSGNENQEEENVMTFTVAETGQDTDDDDENGNDDDDGQEDDQNDSSDQRMAQDHEAGDGSPEHLARSPEDENPAVRTTNEDDHGGDGPLIADESSFPSALAGVRTAFGEDSGEVNTGMINPDILPENELIRVGQDEEEESGILPQIIGNPNDPGVIARNTGVMSTLHAGSLNLNQVEIEISADSIDGSRGK